MTGSRNFPLLLLLLLLLLCATKVALIYLDVSHPVVVKVGRGGEAFAADGTLVGLLAAVDPPVRVERTRRRESLAAHVTNVWLFTYSTRGEKKRKEEKLMKN